MATETREPAFVLDISPLVSPRTAVWPGDVAYRRDVALSIAAGAHLELSSITTTVHVGAHTDAPSHYIGHGEAIHARDPARYVGPCQIVHVDVARGERIRPHHLTVPVEAPRVLFRTGTFPDPEHWNSDFASLSPELVAHLHDRGVRLVGLDTPSVDPEDSKALESHHAIAERDMAILEGVVLDHVAPGLYTLVALPLKLDGADASPVRAVLLPLP
jgi:arylformamidase